MAFFALLFSYKRFINDAAVLFSVGILALILCLTLTILFSRAIFTKLASVFNRFASFKQGLLNFNEYILFFRNKRKILALDLALSFFIQVLGSIVYYLLALSLNINLPLIYFLIFVPIINAIAVLPITIGGLGLRDSSAVFFFAKIGVEANLAVSLSLIWFLLTVVVGLAGGILYVCTLSSRRI